MVVPPTFTYAERSSIPFAALATSKVTAVQVEVKADPKLSKDVQPVLSFHSGEELAGLPIILRFLARAGADQQLLGASPLASCQVDQLVDFAASQLVSGAGLERACASLNDHLAARTLLVGHAPTLADIACWGQLQGNPQWGKLRRSFPHLSRWHDFVSALPALRQVAEGHAPKRPNHPAVAASGSSANGKAQEVGGSFDIGLVGAEHGSVVTRFPPEPSGYLHIGHAKAALLNQEIADRYGGRMLVRFDDTNPTKEKDEFVESIVEDIGRLGLRFDKITYTSDYFPQLMQCAERLIRAGLLYADDTPVDKMREERMAGVESARRNRSVDESLAAWAEMKAGTEEGRRSCLRLKLDAGAGNTALRDPTAYRCNPVRHWRTGDTYKCYPTYDFACPFVDALEGVTHALRTSEYKDREAQFYWVLRLQQGVWPGLPHVHMWDYARLSFVHTVLSKRKLTWFVERGVVGGWDDPRMPTVQGMMRRGLQLPALREFIIGQGASKNVTFQEWDKIWTINKKVIDPICPRHTAVSAAGRVPVALAGGPEPAETAEVARHAKYPPAGTKLQLRSRSLWVDQADAAAMVEGEEVTLMAWGNAVIEKIHREGGGGTVTGVEARLHLEGDFKRTKLKVTWLGESRECPPLELHYFGYLITKRKLEEEDAFEDFVNRDSCAVVRAVGDANMRSLKKGEVLQLERKGYFIVDVAHDAAAPEKPIVLFNIPDGRAKNMPGGALP